MKTSKMEMVFEFGAGNDFCIVGKPFLVLLLLFFADPVVVVNGQGPVTQVDAILGDRAFIPCDMSSPRTQDSATLVLWYKETEENPVYSYDNRRNLPENGSHWKDNIIFGSRAFFHSKMKPSSLSLDNINETDEGYYRCRVDFDGSPTKNQKLHLNVIVPPGKPSIFDENGNNLTEGLTRAYEEGATMTLKCISRGGRPKPQLQWRREGMFLDSRTIATTSFQEPNASSASITITNMNRSHYRTKYSCLAVNNNVTTPASRMVTINMFLAPLNVTITNDTRQLSAGHKYQIHCQTIGSVPPSKITWWLDDQPINHLSEISNSIYEWSHENITSSILAFTPIKENNNSTIKCIATNPNVKTWRKETLWTLDVIYPPDVTLMLGPEFKTDAITEDSDVYFYCKIDSSPPVYKIIWKHNGVSIYPNLKNEIRVNDKSLILRRVKKESIGNYTCEAFNVEGEKESNPVELKIAYKPVCKPNQKVMYGAGRKENIQVFCEVDSNPEPDSFKWSFNHSQEPFPEKRYSVANKKGGVSILTFTPRSEMDFGFLFCSAVNRVGNQLVPCHYQIIPAATPHPPHNCTIGNVTTVSLEVYCRPSFDGGLNQSFLLQVINFTTGNLVLNITAPEPHFRLSRLSPGNSIQVKVYAINPKGSSLPFELEGTTLKAEKHIGLPGTMKITPFLALIICVCGFILLFVFVVVCLARRRLPSLRKSSRKPTILCIKEKTRTALLENRERDEKDPDLIPFKKNTGYQVLRKEANFEDNISKNIMLPKSHSSLKMDVNDHKLVSNDELLNFINYSKKEAYSLKRKNCVMFSKDENT